MNTENYEQIAINEKKISINSSWITEEDKCKVLLWDGSPISVTPPNFVELEIIETEPGLKGDTVSGGTKLATLSTGVEIKVPLFISRGDTVIVDTRKGEYSGRK